MEVQEVTEPVREATQFNTDLRQYLLDNFLIEGKTMTEWKRHFFVAIPEEINFHTVIRLTQEIATKYQEAARFRDEFSVQLAIVEQSRQPRYNEAFNNVRNQYASENNGRTLAAESCKAAANATLQDLDDAINNQKIVKDFWNETCKTLVEMRKHVETIGRALGGDSWTQRDMVIKTGDR